MVLEVDGPEEAGEVAGVVQAGGQHVRLAAAGRPGGERHGGRGASGGSRKWERAGSAGGRK